MRDLTITELGHIYGAGGAGCSPTPPAPTCKGGSKPKGASKPKGGTKPKGGSKSCFC